MIARMSDIQNDRQKSHSKSSEITLIFDLCMISSRRPTLPMNNMIKAESSVTTADEIIISCMFL